MRGVRPATVALAVSLATCTTAAAALTGPSAKADVGPGVATAISRAGKARVIVAFRVPAARSTVTPATRRGYAATRARILERVEATSGFLPTARWDAVAAMPGLVTREGLTALARDPEVSMIDLDRGGRATDAESLPLIGGDTAHGAGFKGAGVTVAVIDSGVDKAHPDLADAVVAEHCFVTPSGCPNGSSEQDGPGSARDDNGHGTNVAGVIASNGTVAPVGVAPDVSLVAIRVLDAAGRFQTSSQVVSALNWIATSRTEVRVVNLSLGTDQLFAGACDGQSAFTAAYASVVNALRTRGTLVFASSGNSAAPTQMGAPACVAAATAVGAVYDSALGPISFPNVCADSQTAADQVTCFSNGGSALDLLAPGALITSTGRGGGTSTYLGTSQASPHAAGAAALLLQQTASLTSDQIEARLKSTGVVLTDPRSGLTAARIHVAAALGQGPTPQPPPPPVDRSAPTARALPGTYKPGASTRLLFTMGDDSGEARSVMTVRAASGRVLKTYRSGFRATASGSVYSYTWRAPASTKGTLRHCVEAFDRAGNAGKRSCAPIRRR